MSRPASRTLTAFLGLGIAATLGWAELPAPLARLPTLPLPAGIEVEFAREGVDLVERMATLVQHARREVLVSQYAITDPRIVAALRAARQRGVIVAALLERAPALARYQTPGLLRRAGVAVIAARPGRDGPGWHNQRYLIVDREAVAVASCDLTAAAARNHENLLVLREAAVVARFYNCWLDEAADGAPWP